MKRIGITIVILLTTGCAGYGLSYKEASWALPFEQASAQCSYHDNNLQNDYWACMSSKGWSMQLTKRAN